LKKISIITQLKPVLLEKDVQAFLKHASSRFFKYSKKDKEMFDKFFLLSTPTTTQKRGHCPLFCVVVLYS